MADRWKTFLLDCNGGLIQNMDVLDQAKQAPGSAIILINFEPGIKGGYRRINGYSKYNTNAVTGTGVVLGCGVFGDVSQVLAARNGDFYWAASGSGAWTKYNSDIRTTPAKVRFYRYVLATPTIVMTDGTNAPAKWDGTTYTILATAPVGAKYSAAFSQCLVLSGYGNGNLVTFSAPGDDTNYTSAAGAIEVDVGDIVTGIKPFRDALYIFCKSHIFKITGSSSYNFILSLITDKLGCIAADSIQEINGDLLFLAQNGVRPISATERMSDVELTSVSKQVLPSMHTFISTYINDFVSSCVIVGKNQYRLFGTKTNDPIDSNVAFLGYVDGKGDASGVMEFEWSQIQGIQASCADSGFISGNEVVIHGNYDGFIYQQESGNSFDGANIFAQYKTPYLVFDDPTFRKTLYRVSVFNEIEGIFNLFLAPNFDYNDYLAVQPSVINLTGGSAVAVYDSVATYDTTFTYDAIQTPRVNTPLIGSGLSAALSFYSSDTNPPYTIKSLAIEYGLGGRR